MRMRVRVRVRMVVVAIVVVRMVVVTLAGSFAEPTMRANVVVVCGARHSVLYLRRWLGEWKRTLG